MTKKFEFFDFGDFNSKVLDFGTTFCIPIFGFPIFLFFGTKLELFFHYQNSIFFKSANFYPIRPISTPDLNRNEGLQNYINYFSAIITSLIERNPN